jgi:signal-transduction protein with cAMP-binding, CBS, and nucleotidyltransferase domain
MTLKDIARKVIAQRRKLHEAHVYEIMSKPVLSVLSNMPIPYAARFMTNFNVSYAMVTENNKVIGLVSLNGIVSCWKGQ